MDNKRLSVTFSPPPGSPFHPDYNAVSAASLDKVLADHASRSHRQIRHTPRLRCLWPRRLAQL